ncbi:hypothetical protein KSP40_PGU022490 [Platanthera guangdongensis]|uniref:Uncharacterized protein n=1 Tax=Platanthera guangdongensis TaxID=2320717 RepID=A0ABR2MWK9_9ASPA
MALILDALSEILRKPAIGDIVSELTLFSAPLWVAVFVGVGVVVGWAWKPRWAAGLFGEGKRISDDDHQVVSHESNTYCSSGLQLAIEILYSLRAWLPTYATYMIPGQFNEKEQIVELM